MSNILRDRPRIAEALPARDGRGKTSKGLTQPPDNLLNTQTFRASAELLT